MKKYSLAQIKIVSVHEVEKKYIADTPGVIADIFRDIVSQAPWFDAEKECIVVFILNSKLAIKSWNLVSLGIINQTLIHARECYRAAIVGAGTHIVLAHNHPSGNPSPSADDIRITKDIRQAGKILKIPLLDHIVMGKVSADYPTGFISIKGNGYVDFSA